MAATLTAQQETTQENSLLDRAFGSANAALDIWSRWQGQKADNQERKAAIPTTVGTKQPTVTAAFSQQTLLLIGGAILTAVLILPRLFRS
jgi:hypothetical protein